MTDSDLEPTDEQLRKTEDRAWEIVRRAYLERPARSSSHGVRRTRTLIPVLVALGAIVVAAVLSPPGRAVFQRVRQAVGVDHADLALFALPAPGRLLVVSTGHGGVWLVRSNGFKRRLGGYDDGQWSPHGRFVVVTEGDHLLALDPEAAGVNAVRWSLTRRHPTSARWEGTRTDTRIAYLTAAGLRVVAGDGTGDHLLDRQAHAAAPAWDPARLHTVAYFAGGAIVLRAADSGQLLWRRTVNVVPNALQWSDDGAFLAVTSSPQTVVLDASGRVRHSVSMLGAHLTQTAFKPRTHDLAISLRFRVRSELRLVDVDHPGHGTLLFAGPGIFGDLAWAPNGRWLLLAWPSANQWLFVNGARVHAVGNIAEEFPRGDDVRPLLELAGRWCCS